MTQAVMATACRGEPALNRQHQNEAADGHQRRKISMIFHWEASLCAVSTLCDSFRLDSAVQGLQLRCNYGAGDVGRERNVQRSMKFRAEDQLNPISITLSVP